jgi:hypothetical protein
MILAKQKEMMGGLVQLLNLIIFHKDIKMDNFISLSNDEILIYNIINTKIYKYFLNYYSKTGSKFFNDINDLQPLKQYEISKKYCKSFKYDYCLCYRQSLKTIINNFDDFDDNLFICSNNKKIIYNFNNFNFINPIFINKKNKIYPINIFTFYRQEYIPFIIKEEFIKIKNKYYNIILKRLKKYFKIFIYSINIYSKCNEILLYKYFNKIKYNFKNSYYNDLKYIFDKSLPSSIISNNTNTNTATNYSLILSVI